MKLYEILDRYLSGAKIRADYFTEGSYFILKDGQNFYYNPMSKSLLKETFMHKNEKIEWELFVENIECKHCKGKGVVPALPTNKTVYCSSLSEI